MARSNGHKKPVDSGVSSDDTAIPGDDNDGANDGNSTIKQAATKPKKLVVIGSSAGGIHALTTLVGSLPADFPAPIVLAQHLDPHRPSNLPEILEHRSTLPVITVSAVTKLEPGTIYLVPSNRHIFVADGHVEPESEAGEHSSGARSKPSVDVLLKSAAQSYGDRLIAVVLTGSGADGAAGAVEVKKAGGTVVIQNPKTALYPSMPLALPPTAVDYVVDIEDLGRLLYDLLLDLPAPPAPDADGQGQDGGQGQGQDGGQGQGQESAVQSILSQVTRQAHLDFRQYKPSTILRRISRRLAATHIQSLPEYSDYLGAHPEEVAELVMSFLIKVTEFFRDQQAFAYLESHILPQLIERGRANGNVLRLWSAGCATGEEPYSLALLLADALGPELAEWNIKIFATDLDAAAIDFARRGLYPENVLNNLPDHYLTRFFERVELGCRINKPLRQLVIFGLQDLSRGVPFPRIDLAVCRNLLIYFKPDLQHVVLEKFAYSLYQTQGFLFLGHAETVRPSQVNFALQSKKFKVYKCTSRPQLVEAIADGRRTTANLAGHTKPRSSSEASPLETGAGNPQSTTQNPQLVDLVLRLLPSGVVTIDRSYHILTLNAAARRLLGIPEGGLEQDFLHTARGLPYTEVRGAIDTAFRERSAVTLSELELHESAGGSGRCVSVVVTPLEGEGNVPPVDMAMITIQDVTDTAEARRSLRTVETEQKQLLQELQIANRRLSDLNKELQDSNEELQVANEELTVAQEELQATNEEYEATNEELQATNEELETSNEEIQATNEELESTNDELAARSHDLHELSRVLAKERAQLAEIVELAPYYIMVMRGPRLAVEAVNPLFQDLFAERKVAGRPLDEVLRGSALADLVDKIWEAYRQNAAQIINKVPMRLPKPGEGGHVSERYFDYTIVPLHDGPDNADGVVIYAEDMTDRERASEELERIAQLKDLFLSSASHELRTPLVPMVGYSDMLVRLVERHSGEKDWDIRINDYLERLRRQLKHLRRLVDDLFDVARMENGKLALAEQPVDLSELVNGALDEACMINPKHDFQFDEAEGSDDGPLVVLGDEVRLRQVMSNLLQNAVKYAPASKKIFVRLGRDSSDKAGEYAKIEVQDFGRGISPKDLTEIFNRFYQAENQPQSSGDGLGLGLFIAKSIAEQHGGTVSAISTPGEGSTFTLRLLLAGTRNEKLEIRN